MDSSVTRRWQGYIGYSIRICKGNEHDTEEWSEITGECVDRDFRKVGCWTLDSMGA